MSDPLPPRGVLVISPTFHPEKVGTPHYISDFVRLVHRGGTRVQVVTNQPFYPGFVRFAGYGPSRRRDRVGDVSVYRLPTIVPRRGNPVWRIATEANMLLQVCLALLLRRVRRSSAVVAVSPGAPAAIVAGHLLRTRSGHLTVVVHDIGFGLAQTTGGRLGRLLTRAIRNLETWALNRADHVTVLSDEMGTVLRAAGVTSPISTVELWPTIDPVDAPPDPSPVVLYSGNLGRKQGVHGLLDLAANLRTLSPAAQLVIRGDGSEREALVESVLVRGLDNVVFDALVPAADLARSLAAARVHVVPQLPEGSAYAVPSKIINILAVGRPVVVTARAESPVGRLAERCPAVTVVDPDDDRAFAGEVSRILSLPDREYQELCERARSWAAGVSREDAIRRTLAGIWTEGEPWRPR